ncbi:hypothetical protein [Ciceribacter selenitireducens]|uniref:Uncharacterized protein n=1 Tax=Ciceribacter selenitireducens ATCC BAA-1503 TaxID=1336235 RepID=A0A376AL55_9HYPH|nr:hypothetical protein [Ciceribacter selenitireducens]SSC68529.1 unnamed protein product [Ciceribacter selenitireducens ATCC BAA-1503]
MSTIIPLLALGVIVTVLVAAIRSMRRPKPRRPPYELIDASPEEMERRAMDLRDRLSRDPFGQARATALWRKLASGGEGEGLIVEFHRDFCGHGLVRRSDRVVLCDVFDGGGQTGEPIAAWNDETDFVAFFAGQSDFSCSGWDAREPVFHTTDPWYRNNQRITGAAIDAWLAKGRF